MFSCQEPFEKTVIIADLVVALERQESFIVGRNLVFPFHVSVLSNLQRVSPDATQGDVEMCAVSHFLVVTYTELSKLSERCISFFLQKAIPHGARAV